MTTAHNCKTFCGRRQILFAFCFVFSNAPRFPDSNTYCVMEKGRKQNFLCSMRKDPLYQVLIFFLAWRKKPLRNLLILHCPDGKRNFPNPVKKNLKTSGIKKRKQAKSYYIAKILSHLLTYSFYPLCFAWDIKSTSICCRQ